MPHKDTIAAIASPHGVGGIGVIRLSGSQAKTIAEKIIKKPVTPKDILFASFYDQQKQTIDHGIVLYFKAPNSFTGEDVIEFQGHGGPVIQDMLLQEINALGARPAKPGEFSERAFLNDKIDLTQAEAIADLIASASQAAAKAAMRSLQGDFSKQIHLINEQIINLRCYIEASLDFSEEDIDFLAAGKVQEKLQIIEQDVNTIIKNAENGRRLNEGLTLAIAGLPNAGKSSLLNTLTGYETAIVTPIEGTTRDIISEQISLNGVPIKILDTAGLRESNNIVEQAGVKKAWSAIKQADIVLMIVDAEKGFTQADQAIIDRLDEQKFALIYNKIDLVQGTLNKQYALNKQDMQNKFVELHISTISKQGIHELIDWLTGSSQNLNENNTILARRRHIDALLQTQKSIKTAIQLLNATQSAELMAEDLRAAQKSLNEITGEFNTEDLLGKIFSSFCIGK